MFLVGQGRFAEAQVVAKETLDRRTRVFGTDHPATLVAFNVMGLVHVRLKQLDEAGKYWKEATHPDTLLYMQNLGVLFIEQKKTAEADELLQEVIRTGSPAIGSGHPTILSAIRRRSGLLIAQKLHAQAIDLLTGAEADARKSYTGSSEAELADFLSLLATARAGAAQFSDGEANLLEAHAIFTKTRGEAHQKTIDCTKALADLYDRWNTADPGKGHDQKASEWRKKIPEKVKPDSGK